VILREVGNLRAGEVDELTSFSGALNQHVAFTT